MVGSSICLNSVLVRLPAVGKPALARAVGWSPWPQPGGPRLSGRLPARACSLVNICDESEPPKGCSGA